MKFSFQRSVTQFWLTLKQNNKNHDIIQVHVKSKLILKLTEGDTIICRKNYKKEAKEYDDKAIGTYKVKHVHGIDSLKPVGHILIELLFLINCSLIVRLSVFLRRSVVVGGLTF